MLVEEIVNAPLDVAPKRGKHAVRDDATSPVLVITLAGQPPESPLHRQAERQVAVAVAAPAVRAATPAGVGADVVRHVVGAGLEPARCVPCRAVSTGALGVRTPAAVGLPHLGSVRGLNVNVETRERVE